MFDLNGDFFFFIDVQIKTIQVFVSNRNQKLCINDIETIKYISSDQFVFMF